MAGRLTRQQQGAAVGRAAPDYRAVSARPMRGLPARSCGSRTRRRAAARSLPLWSNGDTSALSFRTPIFSARYRDYSALARICHKPARLLIIIVTEILSLGAIRAARRMGPTSSPPRGQSSATPSISAPHGRIGLPAARNRPADARRLVGETLDAEEGGVGADALDPPEQHIRRERRQQHLHQMRAVRARLFDPTWRCSAKRG